MNSRKRCCGLGKVPLSVAKLPSAYGNWLTSILGRSMSYFPRAAEFENKQVLE
jgi:hypothetical protein